MTGASSCGAGGWRCRRARCEPAFAALVGEKPPAVKATKSVIEFVVGDVVIRAEPGVDDRQLSGVIRIVRAAQ